MANGEMMVPRSSRDRGGGALLSGAFMGRAGPPGGRDTVVSKRDLLTMGASNSSKANGVGEETGGLFGVADWVP